jgi:hypothetical protein
VRIDTISSNSYQERVLAQPPEPWLPHQQIKAGARNIIRDRVERRILILVHDRIQRPPREVLFPTPVNTHNPQPCVDDPVGSRA